MSFKQNIHVGEYRHSFCTLGAFITIMGHVARRELTQVQAH
jgi:hypothetical protein